MILLESCASFLKVCQKQSSSGVWFYLFKKKRFTLETNCSCVFNTFSVLHGHTDISTWTAGGWASEERKPSTHTDWRVGSCYTSKWLLHSAQLTLQQGSTAGNTRKAYQRISISSSSWYFSGFIICFSLFDIQALFSCSPSVSNV